MATQVTLNSGSVDSAGSLALKTNGTTTAVTINASQGVEFNAGTAALPVITTTGDTNTGIFFSAADTIDFAEGGVATGQFDSSGNFKFNSGFGSVATAYGCRAWVNFNGTGTVAIRASGNVSSITDNGVGIYAVIFSNSITDANFSAVASSSLDKVIRVDIYSTGAVRVVTDAATTDASIVSVAIFR